MRLAVSVQSRDLGIPPNAHNSKLVNDHAAVRNAVRIRAIGLDLSVVSSAVVSSAGGFDNLAESLLHVFRHFDFVVAPLPVEAKHGNPPFVCRVRINVAIAVLVGNHFTAASEADVDAIGVAASLLEADAIALSEIAHAVKFAHSRHGLPAAEFNVISAQEI